MPTEGTTEYAIGTDQTSHRRWLVQERDKTIALWIKAVEAKEDEKVLVKYRAMAIALGELIESLDAVKSVATPKYYVNRPSSRSKSEPGRLSGGKRIPGPAFRITLSEACGSYCYAVTDSAKFRLVRSNNERTALVPLDAPTA